ncbi:MAG: lamin tail domain-containing protein, partial [Verrucomicrobiota bacterium]
TNVLLANEESHLARGVKGDYLMYRGVIDPRFRLLCYDFDDILFRTDADIMQMRVLPELDRLLGHPEILPQYYGVLLEMIETVFSKEVFDPMVENLLGDWVWPEVVEEVIAFADGRRANVLNQIPSEYTYSAPSIGVADNGTFPLPDGVRLNEILAINETVMAVGTTYPDMIELYNGSDVAVDLGGMSISDDAALPTKFVFAAGTMIEPGGYLTLNGGAPVVTVQGVFLGFSLNGEGETVTLFDSAGAIVDTVTFGFQLADHSVGRVGAGGVWRLGRPTPGASNVPVLQGNGAGVRINEWMARSEFRANDDFLELYNPSSRPVSLGGFYLDDRPFLVPHYHGPHRLPPLSFIAPGGYLAFEADGNASFGPDHLNFALSSWRDWIGLFDANARPVDTVFSQFLTTDVSEGRTEDGGTMISLLPIPTPGGPNVLSETDLALLESLRITEIFYHSPSNPGLEFVELRNIGDSVIPLGGVRLSEGVNFTFGSIDLPPGAYVVVVRDLAVFQAVYGMNIPVAGVYSGKLSNGGEEVALVLPGSDSSILRFDYNDNWFPTTDGGGNSLQILDSRAEPASWDAAGSWVASSLVGGTPGGDINGVVPPRFLGLTVLSDFASEDGEVATLRFWRYGSDAVTIPLEVGGTAAPGTDFSGIPSTVQIPAGESFFELEVVALDDSELESVETVVVSLGTVPGFEIPND